MVSKAKSPETASPDKSEDMALMDQVCSSAHQIWQAGLGAFSTAQEEGGEVFSRLVQEGADLQKRMQQLAGDSRLGLADTVTRVAENAGKQASGSWEKLEKIFEERLARSLRSVGVPTRDDIHALSAKIDELNRSVAEFTQKKATSTPAKRAAKAPAKSASKAAAAKPPARANGKKQTRATASRM